MRNALFVLPLAGLLVACASPGEQAARMDRDAKEMIAANDAACTRQGYAPDSYSWRNCIYQETKADLSTTGGTEWNTPLILRVGQRLGLIRAG